MRRWFAILALLALVFSIAPVRAEVVVVDPNDPPAPTLDEAELGKLRQLQSATPTQFYGDISPDDTWVPIITQRGSGVTYALLNINDGTQLPLDGLIGELTPFTPMKWRDPQTLSYISAYFSDEDDDFGLVVVRVLINPVAGTVERQRFDLVGDMVSISPNGARLLVAIRNEPTEDEASLLSAGVFDITLRSRQLPGFGKVGFDAGSEFVKLASETITLAVVDIDSGSMTPLLTLPPRSGLLSEPAWSADSNKLALARLSLPDISDDRFGTELADITTQDSVGNIPPEANPFRNGNFVDVFDLGRGDMRPEALKASESGDLFGRVSWSTDGQTLLTQMLHPSHPAGRPHPVYQFPDRSYVRFYNTDLQQIGTLDAPELAAPGLSVPRFVSPDEVIFNAPYKLSYRLFYYNRVSGELRQLSVWDGTYYQVRATHQSRQLAFVFSSFDRPLDIYRISWEGTGLVELTFNNAELAAAHQVRADPVSFTLSSGATRSGYLIQQAGAAFPPQNVPIVVWQQGGPGGAITNEWASNVEQPFNLLPHFGMAVLVVPLVGREGWGPEFYNALVDGRNFGAVDIDEQAEIVGQLIARGYTSRGRVGITGCSYGGYFTMQSIIRHPTLYSAANTQCTLLDLYREWQFGFTPLISYLEGRVATVAPAEYGADSPIYNATGIRTPLLIFSGINDFLPFHVSDNLHDQVAANGTPVKFLKFPGNGHGLQRAESQLSAAEAQISWFRQYLK